MTTALPGTTPRSFPEPTRTLAEARYHLGMLCEEVAALQVVDVPNAAERWAASAGELRLCGSITGSWYEATYSRAGVWLGSESVSWFAPLRALQIALGRRYFARKADLHGWR